MSKISTLFDPLGFVTLFVVRAKILMQEVWISGIDWDDQLPENISGKARKWFAELQDLGNIKIGRCLRRPTTQVVTDQSFHVFSDASEDAYAAVMYESDVYEDGSVSISFITSKSKVVSLNAHSIPQLEPLGAIWGLHLCQVVSKVLGDHVIKSFAANRIGEIHTITEPTQSGMVHNSCFTTKLLGHNRNLNWLKRVT